MGQNLYGLSHTQTLHGTAIDAYIDCSTPPLAVSGQSQVVSRFDLSGASQIERYMAAMAHPVSAPPQAIQRWPGAYSHLSATRLSMCRSRNAVGLLLGIPKPLFGRSLGRCFGPRWSKIGRSWFRELGSWKSLLLVVQALRTLETLLGVPVSYRSSNYSTCLPSLAGFMDDMDNGRTVGQLEDPGMNHHLSRVYITIYLNGETLTA